MPQRRGNLFDDIPPMLDEEAFLELVATPGLRIERIVSTGQATPPGEWLEQEKAEWVLLLEGSAGLGFEGDQTVRRLGRGDWVEIPARAPHRVEWTEPGGTTIWLAVHYE